MAREPRDKGTESGTEEAQPQAALPAPAKTTQVVVGAGRTVMYSAQIGVDEAGKPVFETRTAGPGSIIDLPHHDAAHVKRTGFTQSLPEEPPQLATDRELAEERGATINGDDGKVIRGS